MQHVTLNTGARMPILGFGVFQIAHAKECGRRATAQADG